MTITNLRTRLLIVAVTILLFSPSVLAAPVERSAFAVRITNNPGDYFIQTVGTYDKAISYEKISMFISEKLDKYVQKKFLPSGYSQLEAIFSFSVGPWVTTLGGKEIARQVKTEATFNIVGDANKVVRSVSKGACESFLIEASQWIAVTDTIEFLIVRLLPDLAVAGGDARLIFELLTGILQTGDRSMVRQAAADGLGSLGDKRAVKYLVAALEKATGSFETLSIAEALGKLGDPEAVEPLRKALSRMPESDLASKYIKDVIQNLEKVQQKHR